MSKLTQNERFISIDSPLAKDELLLTSFSGTDRISEPFKFTIEVLSENHSIKPEQLIAEMVTLTVHNSQKTQFNGYISDFTYGEIKAEDLRNYRMTMRPWLWFLSKTSDHRIFQKKTTKEIVIDIFKDNGFSDFEFRAEGNTTQREYCVQHNETDLHFVSRLLEEDGIAYYFEQKDNKHILIIVDEAHAYEECAETDLTYSKGSQPNTQITRWEHGYQFKKGKWSLNDYDDEMPEISQLKETTSISKFSTVKNYEHYEYTPYHDYGSIQDLTKKRMQTEEAKIDTVSASSNCSSLYAGGRFNLSKHTVKKEQGVYILTSVEHNAFENSYLATNTKNKDDKKKVLAEYKNNFICIPEKVHYRPPLTHIKPVMSGSQSALVVGPAGEEIYVDDDGRIKVQFHWDRLGKKNEKSTCWIRVMQPWSGAGWGVSFIPRIGMEVLVNFLEGDADRPVILGSVYNGSNKPPFKSKTQSGIRTRSSQKGTGSNCNEFRFDDKKAAEQIYIHAEKNMDTEVENDETLTVDNDRTKIVNHDENSIIENDRNKTVNNNQSETITKNKTIKVGVNHVERIGKNMSTDVENISSLVAGDEITFVTGKSSIVMTSDGTITIKGVDINVIGSGEINEKAKGNIVMKGKKILEN